MDERIIRVGNLVCDAKSKDEIRVGLDELCCAYLFVPLLLNERHLAGFKTEMVEGKEIHYRSEGENMVVVERLGDEVWRVSIHSKHYEVEGRVVNVHELQNLLVDCGLYWL